MSDFDYPEKTERHQADELYSVPVKAGKRIYYFDVKATRNNDNYITITESRKRQMKDGGFMIDKHKLHLYKEDFEKFVDGLQDVINYIKRTRPEIFENLDAYDSYERTFPEESDQVKELDLEL